MGSRHFNLQNLNPHNASGQDSIPIQFLKETASGIAPASTFVYQASLQQKEDTQ